MRTDLVSQVVIGVIVAFIAFGIYYRVTIPMPAETFSGIFLPQNVSENLPYAMLGKWGGQDTMGLGEGYFYTFSQKTLTDPNGSQYNVTKTETRQGKKLYVHIDVR